MQHSGSNLDPQEGTPAAALLRPCRASQSDTQALRSTIECRGSVPSAAAIPVSSAGKRSGSTDRRDRQFGRSAFTPAFTLVELLVVIGVIAVLVAMLLPALARVRESGNSIRCRANLTQIGAALRQYANENGDHFPNPEALGDHPATVASPVFRRGINEPDPSDPAIVETKGMPNLLYRLGYLTSEGVWLCPSQTAGWGALFSEKNKYGVNVTRTNAAMTSLKRSRIPLHPINKTPLVATWWSVQCNWGVQPFPTNQPKLPTSTISEGGAMSYNLYYPHEYRVRRNVSEEWPQSKRRGSTNVLFLDGVIGMYLFERTPNDTTMQTAVRGE